MMRECHKVFSFSIRIIDNTSVNRYIEKKRI